MLLFYQHVKRYATLTAALSLFPEHVKPWVWEDQPCTEQKYDPDQRKFEIEVEAKEEMLKQQERERVQKLHSMLVESTKSEADNSDKKEPPQDQQQQAAGGETVTAGMKRKVEEQPGTSWDLARTHIHIYRGLYRFVCLVFFPDAKALPARRRAKVDYVALNKQIEEEARAKATSSGQASKWMRWYLISRMAQCASGIFVIKIDSICVPPEEQGSTSAHIWRASELFCILKRGGDWGAVSVRGAISCEGTPIVWSRPPWVRSKKYGVQEREGGREDEYQFSGTKRNDGAGN